MRYLNVISGRFLARINRFVAKVEINGQIETVHVKNTGRCRELLIVGAEVYLEKGTNPNRKTAYDLIAVRKGDRLINMDSQAPNHVFREWAEKGGFLPDVTELRNEYSYGGSRLDFCLTTPEGLHFVEVKGVTLEDNNTARFPDAPTERGIKHLRGLMECVKQGYEAYAVFIIQMRGIDCFEPAWDKHREFALTLQEADRAGVKILAIDCDVTREGLNIAGRVPVKLCE